MLTQHVGVSGARRLRHRRQHGRRRAPAGAARPPAGAAAKLRAGGRVRARVGGRLRDRRARDAGRGSGAAVLLLLFAVVYAVGETCYAVAYQPLLVELTPPRCWVAAARCPRCRGTRARPSGRRSASPWSGSSRPSPTGRSTRAPCWPPPARRSPYARPRAREMSVPDRRSSRRRSHERCARAGRRPPRPRRRGVMGAGYLDAAARLGSRAARRLRGLGRALAGQSGARGRRRLPAGRGLVETIRHQ